MITKGQITSIDLSGNTCSVRMPFFESAGNDEISGVATISNTPGSYNGYKVGDVVWVAFENNLMELPVVIGKLYLGAELEKADPRGTINVETSATSKSATIPFDTKMSSSLDKDTPNTTAPYFSLSSLTAKVSTLDKDLGQMDRDYGNRFKQVITSQDNQNKNITSLIEQTAKSIRSEVTTVSDKADANAASIEKTNEAVGAKLNKVNDVTGFGWNLDASKWTVYAKIGEGETQTQKNILVADSGGLGVFGTIVAEHGQIGASFSNGIWTGGFEIGDSVLQNGYTLPETDNSAITLNSSTNGAVLMSTGTGTKYLSINDNKVSNLVFAAGDNFGVNNLGNLYANNANITGNIDVKNGSVRIGLIQEQKTDSNGNVSIADKKESFELPASIKNAWFLVTQRVYSTQLTEIGNVSVAPYLITNEISTTPAKVTSAGDHLEEKDVFEHTPIQYVTTDGISFIYKDSNNNTVDITDKVTQCYYNTKDEKYYRWNCENNVFEDVTENVTVSKDENGNDKYNESISTRDYLFSVQGGEGSVSNGNDSYLPGTLVIGGRDGFMVAPKITGAAAPTTEVVFGDSTTLTLHNILNYAVTGNVPKLTMLDDVLTASGSTLTLDGGMSMTGLIINYANINGANIAGDGDTSTTICGLPIQAYVSTVNKTISATYTTTPTIDVANDCTVTPSTGSLVIDNITIENDIGTLKNYTYYINESNSVALSSVGCGFGTIYNDANTKVSVILTITYTYEYAVGTTSAGTAYSASSTTTTRIAYIPYSELLNKNYYELRASYTITPPKGNLISIDSIACSTISLTRDFQDKENNVISLDKSLINGIRFGTDDKEAAIRVNELTADSVSNTSDRRLKTGIKYALSGYDALFDSLKPASFKFKNNRAKTRFGFVAQDVESAMSAAGLNPTDFGIVSKNFIDGKSVYALNYTDLHALEIYEIQKLKKEVEELKAKLGEK